MPRAGMMEWWNIGMLILKGSYPFPDFPVKRAFAREKIGVASTHLTESVGIGLGKGVCP